MLSSRRATITGCFASHLRVISIHALLAESDLVYKFNRFFRNLFLSTLSLRRATEFADEIDGLFEISIHALLAESDEPPIWKLPAWIISIHALLAESDAILEPLFTGDVGFLSTLSLRRATQLPAI